jgi:hypothetical protein
MINRREQFYIDQNNSGENGWKTAIMDELSTCMIYHDIHEENPRRALDDCIQWNVDVALDPLVSSSAAELIEQGKLQAELQKPFVNKHWCKYTGFVYFGCALTQLLIAILDKNLPYFAMSFISLCAAWMSYVAYRNANK